MRIHPEERQLKRDLGLLPSLGLVVGTVIGTGEFLKAAVMTQETGGFFWMMVAWVAAGVLSLTGAFCYAELGGRFPHAGGEYVYLREAFGGLTGFLNGWMRFWIGNPGSMAAYGVGTVTFLNAIVPFSSPLYQTLTAVGVIIIFTLLNCLTVKMSGNLQALLTGLKILMIFALTVMLLVPHAGVVHTGAVNASGAFPGWNGFGLAMLAALWAYDGWNGLSMIGGEIREPRKNIPIALVGGMTFVMLIYLLANWSYFSVLTLAEVASANSPAHPAALPVATMAAFKVFGQSSLALISLGLAFSAIVSLNGSILSGSRIPFAMAEDGLLFATLKKVGTRSRVPVHAVLAQGSIAVLLACSGSFDELTDYVMFASWIFYALAVVALFIARRKNLGQKPSFYCPGYPVVPLLFFIVSCALVVNAVMGSPRNCMIGLLFIGSGVPFYFYFSKRRA